MAASKYNLIDLFRYYYKLGISSHLPSAANSIFLSLLYTANELYFPKKFTIANSSLCNLAGTKQQNLNRDRRRLVEYKFDDESSWLVKYDAGSYARCGYYYINYELLNVKSNNNADLESELIIELNYKPTYWTEL